MRKIIAQIDVNRDTHPTAITFRLRVVSARYYYTATPRPAGSLDTRPTHRQTIVTNQRNYESFDHTSSAATTIVSRDDWLFHLNLALVFFTLRDRYVISNIKYFQFIFLVNSVKNFLIDHSSLNS